MLPAQRDIEYGIGHVVSLAIAAHDAAAAYRLAQDCQEASEHSLVRKPFQTSLNAILDLDVVLAEYYDNEGVKQDSIHVLVNRSGQDQARRNSPSLDRFARANT